MERFHGLYAGVPKLDGFAMTKEIDTICGLMCITYLLSELLLDIKNIICSIREINITKEINVALTLNLISKAKLNLSKLYVLLYQLKQISTEER